MVSDKQLRHSRNERTLMQSVKQLLEDFRAGKSSPVDVTRAALERIERINGQINAFRVIDGEGALAAAAAAAERWEQGEPQGLLDGVPISVKDTLMAEGFAFRQGSLVTSEVPAKESAPVVRATRQEGAIVVGITTCSEFGSSALTVSPLTGTTVNPHDLSKHSGGSSGGAAASVAAGLLPLGIGSDAAGSVRIPSSFCGVIGFKPSGGLIPAYPRNVAGPLSSPGFIATSVADVTLALRAAVKPDGRDVEAIATYDPDCDATLESAVNGLRIAYSKTLGYVTGLDPEVEQLVTQAVRSLNEQGAIVEEIDPGFSDPEDIIDFHITMGYGHILRYLSEEQLGLLTPSLRGKISAAQKLTAMEFMAAQDRRIELGRQMVAFHQNFDLLITPTMPVSAFDADSLLPSSFPADAPGWAWMRFVYPFNLTQQPAISLPCGMTAEGLPVGLQIVGPRRGDATVLRCAQAFETSREPLICEPALART
jgi:aspartyl-tRNA(Asn)/glutamyl-tRNA(Gln) amidotransferase subunit A